MDADTWGPFETLSDVGFVHGEAQTLAVELLCTGGSPLAGITDARHLGAANVLADALNLPRAVVRGLHVEQMLAREPDPAAVLRSEVGGMPIEVPDGARPRQILTVDGRGAEDPNGERQVMVPRPDGTVPRGARPGSIFVAPRLINGARVDVDVVSVEVPAGFEGGDVIRVRAVGGSVDAVVPHGATEGDVFMAEYHPERSRSPECRVTFEIDQPRYRVDGWEMGTGARQYPLDLMENEMRHRLNTRGCGQVTHISITPAEAPSGFGGPDAAACRLWKAAESGDLECVQQELATLRKSGWEGRKVVNREGPVSGSTALHLAARWGHVHVVQELLLRGDADASLRDGKGRTAEEVAEAYGHGRTAASLAWWKEGGAGQPSSSLEPEPSGSEQATRLSVELLARGSSMSSQELEQQRAAEHVSWKEQQVDQAVALIRGLQQTAPPQALAFEDKACTVPLLEPWPELSQVDTTQVM